MLFGFSLTSGIGVESIEMSLNGKAIKSYTTNVIASLYNEELSSIDLIDQGILVNGWNEYEITVNGKNPFLSNQPFSKNKKYQFYYHSSLVDTQNAQELFDLIAKEDGSLFFYKSIYFRGTRKLVLDNKVLQLGQGSIFEVSGETPLSIKDSEFKFSCGSLLKLVVAKDTTKHISNTIFDGSNESRNMVMLAGEYTGGKGLGSAPSSEIEFVGCKFQNYAGNAVHIREGRSTFVNCTFTGYAKDATAKAVGLANAPGTRADLIGCSFNNNDVAIDAIAAEIIVRNQKDKYKGIAVDSSSITNNYAGIFGYNSIIKLNNINISNNTYGIVEIDGILDADQRAGNKFINNTYGILGTSGLFLKRGHNEFVGNTNDIILLQNDFNPQPKLDASCNWWADNDYNQRSPLIFTTGDMYLLEEMNFNDLTYNPVIEINNKGKEICKGNPKHNADSAFSQKEKLIKNKARSVIFSNRINDYISTSQTDIGTDIYFGSYSNGKKRLKEFSYKANLSSFVLNQGYEKEKSSIEESLKTFHQMSPSKQANYNSIISDKITFLELILKESKESALIQDETIAKVELILYPNPASKHININFNLPAGLTAKSASLKILDVKGDVYLEEKLAVIDNKIRYKAEVSQLSSGIYIIQLTVENKSFSKKFIVY